MLLQSLAAVCCFHMQRASAHLSVCMCTTLFQACLKAKIRARSVLSGLAWAVWFEHIQSRIAIKEPEVAAKLLGYQQHSGPAAKLTASGEQTVPWRGFLRNRPVQALAYTHFCNNW